MLLFLLLLLFVVVVVCSSCHHSIAPTRLLANNYATIGAEILNCTTKSMLQLVLAGTVSKKRKENKTKKNQKSILLLIQCSWVTTKKRGRDIFLSLFLKLST